MNTFCKDIELFLLTSNVSSATKERHRKNLLEFAQFLSNLKNVNLDEVHLLKIFTLTTVITGKVLKHNPINSKVMDHYFETMRQLSYNQMLEIKNSLGAFFRHLEREYHFPNPVRQMEFDFDELKPFKRPIITLSRRDVLRYLHILVITAENFHRDLTMFCLIFATGCRISEILSIRMRQINFSHGLITLERTKSGKSQTVVLRQGMGIVLQFYCEHFNLSSDDYLFLNKYGRPIQYETVRSLFKKYLLAAKIPENHLHATRHSFATHLFENGSDISIIQQLLRHRDKHTTVGYVHPHYVRNYGIKISNNQKLYEKLSSQLS